MPETLNHNPEDEKKVDGFGLSKERRIETVDTNIDLILRRCRRKEIQPRDMLLKEFNDRQEMNERLTDGLVGEINAIVSELPDYDLSNKVELNRARQDIQRFYYKIIDFEYSGSNQSGSVGWQDQVRQDWQQAGIFSYELGENKELILHIPPMSKSPDLSQIKESLKQLALVLEKKPDIQEVRGSSLLLEHPIAKRLGFELDSESDEGFNPNFHMSRKEFIERFGKEKK